MSRRDPFMYRPLSSKDYGREQFTELQFQKPPVKIPWKAIILALCLFVGGVLLILFASLLLTGHINSPHHMESIWPLLVLGSIMFIPGFYHVRIAYYAYKNLPGYSFDDIPDFE